MYSRYVQALARTPLLSAAEEHAAAQALRHLEHAAWEAALGAPGGSAFLARHPSLRTVRGALDATRLRTLDEDGTLLEAVLQHLRGQAGSHAEVVACAHRQALQARNSFARANLRLVISVARRFHPHGMPFMDAVQEGNLGLLKAIHRFDHQTGFRFSTYAYWWIREALEHLVARHGRLVPLPWRLYRDRRRMARVQGALSRELGRMPSGSELAAGLGRTLARVQELELAAQDVPVSLDQPADEDHPALVLPDLHAIPPDQALAQRAETERVQDLVRRLPPMEADVLRRRFGLKGANDETLEEIGRRYAVSRERIRQLQVQGLRRIKQWW